MPSDEIWPDAAAHVPHVVASSTTSTQLSWSTDIELSYDEWLGDSGLFKENDPGWAIGDWLTYGVAHFGNCYGAAVLATGLSRQALMQMARIAGQFAPARRRFGLSLQHHGVVAELSSERQDFFLDRAIEADLSVRRLQAEVNAAQRESVKEHYGTDRRKANRRSQADRRARSLNPYGPGPSPDERIVSCPHCGGQIIV